MAESLALAHEQVAVTSLPSGTRMIPSRALKQASSPPLRRSGQQKALPKSELCWEGCCSPAGSERLRLPGTPFGIILNLCAMLMDVTACFVDKRVPFFVEHFF